MTKQVVKLSSNISETCKHCNTQLKGEDLDDSINHYIKEHGYKILHVGSETSESYDGKLWIHTVAMLGK